jgi:hypothetical protein
VGWKDSAEGSASSPGVRIAVKLLIAGRESPVHGPSFRKASQVSTKVSMSLKRASLPPRLTKTISVDSSR